MKKFAYLLVVLILVLGVIFTFKPNNTKDNGKKLSKIILFGNEVKVDEGNVFIFDLDEMKYKDKLPGSDIEICAEPIEFICENGKSCVQIISSTYNSDDKTYELFILDAEKYSSSDVINVEKNDKIDMYERYNYYVKINNIDEVKAKAAHYCLPDGD